MTKKKRSISKFGSPFEDLQEEKNEGEIPAKMEEKEKKDIPQTETVDEEKQPEEDNEKFLDQFFEEKQTQDKTHTRKTFVVENELLGEIQKYMKKFGHGFQVRFINEAIRNQLKIVEEEAKQLKGKRRPK